MSETLVCGVRFAHAHAPEFGGDPNRLVLAGFSAGAGMGALVALGGETLSGEWDELAAQHDGEPARQIDCGAPVGATQSARTPPNAGA